MHYIAGEELMWHTFQNIIRNACSFLLVTAIA
jgi:hypothetical protein